MTTQPLSYLAPIPLAYRLPLLMSAWPDLHLYGLREARTSDADFASWRFELAKAQDQIEQVMAWLANAPRTRRPQVDSYALKHVFEHAHPRAYLANGILIAAALLCEITVKAFPPNALLAIEQRWVRNLEGVQ